MKNLIYSVAFLLGLLLLGAGKYSSGGVRNVLRTQNEEYNTYRPANFVIIDGEKMYKEPNWLIGSEIGVAITLQNERNPAVANCASGNLLRRNIVA